MLGLDIISASDEMISSIGDLKNSNFLDNMENTKLFPGGPTCRVGDKEVPAMVTCSPSGGITSQLLRDMLFHIDSHSIIPRFPGSPTPCIILDGHSSRLELPFLSYINNDVTRWKALFGIPYGTSLWQAGDSV